MIRRKRPTPPRARTEGDTARQLTRRGFLRVAGATLALPVFESLLPVKALAQDAAPPKRLLFYYVPNGIHMPSWTPATAGRDFTLPLILEPLADLRSEITVLSGLANQPARPDGPGDHAAGTGSFLTATHVYKTEGADIFNGISVDQVAAQAIGDQTQLASLQVGVDGGASVGGCDSGYSCAYSRNISWAGPQTPLPKATNPRLVFDRFFGGYDPEATAAETQRRRLQRSSVLDLVLGQADSLSRRLGRRDQVRLDEYMTGVRELERRIQDSDSVDLCEPPTLPEDDSVLQVRLDIMSELMVLAFQCDLTRLTTFMYGNAGSGRSYDSLGVTGGHHDISHHQDDAANFSKLEVIDRYEVEQFASLLRRLRDVQEADGSTLLDNSLVFFSSEIEDGNSHSHYNLPVLLAGRGGGAVEPGRHVVYQNDEPIADLFISMLASVDVQVDEFGDNGTGPLAGL